MQENLEKIENYELGFHFTPDLEEKEVKSSIEKVEGLLIKLGVTINNIREARRTRLSHPINHKFQSFFGTIDFKSKPEIINELNNELKLQEKIIRYLILKHGENERVLKSTTTYKGKPRTKQVLTPPLPQKDQIKPEDLEKQIEDVIEKL